MKKMIIILMLISSVGFAVTPTIDGVFDGTGVWGSAISTADDVAGWDIANAKNVYMTFDATYVYFGAEVVAQSWYQFAFALNTKAGGGSTEVWSRSIDYGHTNLPDYVIVGHFGGYAEFRTWNAGIWTSSVITANMGENEASFVEAKILKTDIGSPSTVDVQFYLTGDGNNHGTFDACPDDENSTSWVHSSAHTTLNAYQADVSLPVELSLWNGISKNEHVELNWTTESEIENAGFIIERRNENANDWTEISSFMTNMDLKGNGSSTERHEYQFMDKDVTVGQTYAYSLSDVDYKGIMTKHDDISVTVVASETRLKPSTLKLHAAYPNPFNPMVQLSFSLDQNVENLFLEIYNIQGVLVQSITTGSYEAGTHDFDWSGFDVKGNPVSSGIYIVRLASDAGVQIQRVTLLR